MVQSMLLNEMLLVPIPPEVTARVEAYAQWLGADDGAMTDMMRVVRRIANGSLGLALMDFQRSGYFEELLAQPPEHLHTLARTGRRLGFRPCRRGPLRPVGGARALPGRLAGPGRVALLPGAWLHLPGSPRQRAAEPRPARLGPRARRLRLGGRIGDRGLRAHRALQRRSRGRSRSWPWCSGLFETGYLFDAAKGFFEYDRGHLSRDIDRMAVRLADAMYRGRDARVARQRHVPGAQHRPPRH